jgi:SPP1 gp7 family putative phage head morphogenesis protein
MDELDFTDGLAMEEAVRYAEARAIVLPNIYYGTLVGIQKSQATSIAGLASLEQIKHVIGLVTETLKEGKTFKEFKAQVKSGDLSVDLPSYRLGNIFRTNLQVAYNRGRYEQQKRVAHSRPYLMYDAINDSRTRPNHLLMDNTILSRDDPWWRTHYPPCGYRCRCTVISLTEAQAKKRGVSAKGPEVDPDEGWDFNPGEDYEKPLTQALNDFGKDLVESHPRLTKAVQEAKKRVREAAEAAKSDRKDAPTPRN